MKIKFFRDDQKENSIWRVNTMCLLMFFFSFFAIPSVFLFNRVKAGRIGKMNRMPRGNVFLIFYSCCLRESRLFSSRFDLNLEVGVRIAYSCSNVESVCRRARELEGREKKKSEEICTSPAWNDEWAALSILLSDIVLTIKGKRCEKFNPGQTRVTRPLVYNSTRISAHLPFSVVATFGIKYSSSSCDLNNVDTFASTRPLCRE